MMRTGTLIPDRVLAQDAACINPEPDWGTLLDWMRLKQHDS
jgi:hypothetical protein|tara:strand:+ start:442 stop:564 length:123 start_codon:yes stop_codon:yes gene_type:complete